jgi:hypothetical protein
MPNNIIDMIKPTPKLYSKKCRFISFSIKIFLQYTTIALGLITWYLYDYFIAAGVVILSFIIMGIIRSKMRNSVIPPKQREYQYNDKGIADWFTSLEICLEEQNG